MNYRSGFTVVEIILVCVIVGILASITILTFNNIQQTNRDSLRAQTLKEWAGSIKTFQTKYGLYPLPTDTLPSGTGTYYCLSQTNTDTACDSTGVNAVASADLFTALRRIGQLPTTKYPVQQTASGPSLYMQYDSTAGVVSNARLTGTFEKNACADHGLTTNAYTTANPTTRPYLCDLAL